MFQLKLHNDSIASGWHRGTFMRNNVNKQAGQLVRLSKTRMFRFTWIKKTQIKRIFQPYLHWGCFFRRKILFTNVNKESYILPTDTLARSSQNNRILNYKWNAMMRLTWDFFKFMNECACALSFSRLASNNSNRKFWLVCKSRRAIDIIRTTVSAR